RAGDYRIATSRLSEGRRHARALSHYGKMDARVLRVLGLHRFWSVHAHLVCEHPGGDPIFSRAKYAILVGTQHASGDWAVLCTVRDFANALHQEKSAPAQHPCRLDDPYANAGHVSDCFACVTRNRRGSDYV